MNPARGRRPRPQEDSQLDLQETDHEEEAEEEEEEEEEDGALCRFCYQGSLAGEEPLIAPCECAGTVRFVHASCLDQWRMLNLDNDRRLRCQLCQTPFRLQGSNADLGREGGHASGTISILSLAQRLCMRMLTRKFLCDLGLWTCSAMSLVPLSGMALYISRHVRRDDLYVHGSTNVYAQPWRKRVFGSLMSESILQDINLFIVGGDPHKLSRLALFILGLSKLGSYGCTLWLFTDGLAEVLPVQLPGLEALHDRPSPAIAILKAVMEFYMFPFFLRTPHTKLKLPFHLGATGIGIGYILARIHNRLRALLLKHWAFYRALELGQLDTNVRHDVANGAIPA
ncbi:E3 ubiquitin-protein ligase MARCH2 [Hondaea fermentalgiana]|uniref:E3 ubiquitin-protein ligase MARCH2 n=1 Tax=Hondaea fermentalgiana TaxID=2315210 RepID=A0A2R5GM96_9STRA|nr:E3 ubiquitin-protein ligase MARCH2 [Hondaea fermentalgiana]|eukprot:GBG28994.1 E3 ubiquitin-protein ligase MARCH2 [Hondaea fermentalgiana]